MCLRSQAQRRDVYFFIVTSLAFRAKLERVATLEGFAEKISQCSSGYLNQISSYHKMITSGFCQVRDSLYPAFFWTFGKKLKTQGKNSKLKPKAQKVGTFLNFLTFLCEVL